MIIRMTNASSPEMSFPNPEETTDYLIGQLDVSPDIRIVEPKGLLTVVSAALTQRRGVIGFDDPNHQQTIALQYDKLQSSQLLPPHLQSKQAFTNRYQELVGATSEEFFNSEALTTIARNRNRPPSAIRQNFEYGIAHLATAMLSSVLLRSPDWLETICLSTSVGLDRRPYSTYLETGNGLRHELRSGSKNVIQAAPSMNDTIARCEEIGKDGWEYVAMLGSTHFDAELARTVAKVIFGLSPEDRIFASSEGLATGCENLAEVMKANKEIGHGFDAMLLSETDQPLEALTAAIEAAPKLLRPGGVLLISDLHTFYKKEGSVEQLIDHAQTVFGHEPIALGPLALNDDGEGLQALFTRKT